MEKELRTALWTASDADWEAWIDWYEDRLAGRSSFSEAFDIAVATLPNSLWEQGPRVVNARIKELTAEHTPPEPIPAQGAGSHFVLTPDLRIALAPPSEIDADGNNLRRIRQLLPLVRQAAADLAGHLNPNAQPELARIVIDYQAAIAGEPEMIVWGVVFGLGIMLEHAATAAEGDVTDSMLPPIEAPAKAALGSMLTLHGPMVLATKDGRELTRQADEFRSTREQRVELRKEAETVVRSLKASPNVIEQSAFNVAEEAAATLREGPHPERGVVYWLGTIKNLATIAVPAGALGTWAHYVGGAAEDAILFGRRCHAPS